MRREWWCGAIAALALLHGCTRPAAPATFSAAPWPRSGSEVRKAMAAALAAGDKAALSRAALTLAAMGGTLSEAGFAQIAPMLDSGLLAASRAPWPVDSGGDPVAALHAWYRHNADPRQGWDVPARFAEVPAEYRLVEGLAWDSKTDRLFIGTVVDGRLAYLERGQWHEVPLGTPRGGLFGMAVDPARRLLWIATGTVEQVALPGERMAGLIAVDLDSLRVARRVPLAPGAAGTAGDVVLAKDGTVYVSNPVSGALHRCRPGCAVAEDLLPPGSFRSPQGMALGAGDHSLYVADYATGLWIVDPRTAEKRALPVSGPTMFEGIDGLVAMPEPDEATLIAIQNGTLPRRIVKIERHRPGGPVGLRVWSTIAAEAGEPTLGTMRGSNLLFVGDGQWERYGPGGVLNDGKPPRPTPILASEVEDIIVTMR